MDCLLYARHYSKHRGLSIKKKTKPSWKYFPVRETSMLCIYANIYITKTKSNKCYEKKKSRLKRWRVTKGFFKWDSWRGLSEEVAFEWTPRWMGEPATWISERAPHRKGKTQSPESRTSKEVSEAGSEWERKKEVGNRAGKGDNDQAVVAFVGYGKDFE